MPTSDQELIEQFNEGDKQALETLVRKYLGEVYNLSYSLVGKREEAEDITQEVFLRVLKNLHKFDLDRNFKTWILSITHNAAIDYFRKKKYLPLSIFDDRDSEGESLEEGITDQSPLQDKVFEDKENFEYLKQGFLSLLPDEKMIITLRNTDELTFQEISEILDKPMNTVKSRYTRALNKLRNEIIKKKEQ